MEIAVCYCIGWYVCNFRILGFWLFVKFGCKCWSNAVDEANQCANDVTVVASWVLLQRKLVGLLLCNDAQMVLRIVVHLHVFPGFPPIVLLILICGLARLGH